MVRVTPTVWYNRRGRDGASEPIITIDNKAFVLIIEGIIWPNVRGTCPHFSLNSPCSRNSWWGHSKGIRKPQHFTRISTKVPFHKILSGNNLYYCSFNVVETSTLKLQKVSQFSMVGHRQWYDYFESTVRPWDARFGGNGKTHVSQNSCNLSYLIRQRQDHQKT